MLIRLMNQLGVSCFDGKTGLIMYDTRLQYFEDVRKEWVNKSKCLFKSRFSAVDLDEQTHLTPPPSYNSDRMVIWSLGNWRATRPADLRG